MTIPKLMATMSYLMMMCLWSNGAWANVEEACDGGVVLTSPSGIITFPGYPSVYANDLDCTWTIQAAGNRSVRLEFTRLELEPQQYCRYDYVQTENADGQSLRRVCGFWASDGLSQPENILESPEAITIRFHSDDSRTYSGFQVQWTLVEQRVYPGCEGVPANIDASTAGELTSPQYPQAYPAFSDCVHVLSADVGSVIRLDLDESQFDMEYETSCAYDYLEIYDGPSTSSPLLGRKLCGQGSVPDQWGDWLEGFPTTLSSTSNQVTVRFHSDGSRQDKGWALAYAPAAPEPEPTDQYLLVEQACSGGATVQAEESGALASPGYGEGGYPRLATCSWKIQAPSGQVVVLEFDDVDIEFQEQCGYDNVTLYDGPYDTSPVLVTLCGNNIPRDYLSTSNEVLVVFSSDHSVEKRGFKLQYRARPPLGIPGSAGLSTVRPGENGEAVPHSWPWVVALHTRSSPSDLLAEWWLLCGGTVISETWIMTAAHCVDEDGVTTPANLFRVVAGDHHRYLDDGTEQAIMVNRVVKHPRYSPQTTDNDIALLKLSRPLVFNGYVHPIALPTGEPPAMQMAVIAGWGATEATGTAATYRNAKGAVSSLDSPGAVSRIVHPDVTDNSVLNSVFIPIWDQSDCMSTRVRGSLTRNMFCAGYPEGRVDSCLGDSGGPLMAQKEGRYYQHGITSWGYGCGERNSPGVYTRVVNYIPWILNYVTDHYLHQL